MINTITELLIGADVEMFVQNLETGEVETAEYFIEGTKDEPYQFDPENKWFGTSKDNILAEVTIPPTNDPIQWVEYLNKARAFVESRLPKGYCTVAFPAFSINEKFLQTEQALVFGCEPDYNVYTGLRNGRPEATDPNLRSAALHVHFGYKDPVAYNHADFKDGRNIWVMDEQRAEIIKACDLFLGIPSLLIEPENKRRELYGKAGCFRPKPYGVEYRTLGNYYLQNNALTKWVHTSAMAAIDWLNAGNRVEANLSRVLESTINEADTEMAQYIINDFNLKLAA